MYIFLTISYIYIFWLYSHIFQDTEYKANAFELLLLQEYNLITNPDQDITDGILHFDEESTESIHNNWQFVNAEQIIEK